MRTRQTIQNKKQINQKFSLQVMRRKKIFCGRERVELIKTCEKKTKLK